MKEKEIQIKVNKVKFKVWYAEDKTHFHYGLYRNNKALLASTTPIKRKLEVFMRGILLSGDTPENGQEKTLLE
jgi:hypothetical protein